MGGQREMPAGAAGRGGEVPSHPPFLHRDLKKRQTNPQKRRTHCQLGTRHPARAGIPMEQGTEMVQTLVTGPAGKPERQAVVPPDLGPEWARAQTGCAQGSPEEARMCLGQVAAADGNLRGCD